ncbi:MAG TPA: hypothetical protein PKY12_10860 [Catalimonadaceae bacterium]|nr:hypothetical protein [Catalimonadaceae bacterium]
MQNFVYKHFLSGKENARFLLFLAAAFFLLVLGSANKDKPLRLLPAQNQIIDSKPKRSVLPNIHRPAAAKSEVELI